MKIAHYATPHLWGTLDYARPGRLQPDGDTIHVRNPVVTMMGKIIRPEAGRLEVAMPGKKPHVLELRGDPPGYLPIRLRGLRARAPERPACVVAALLASSQLTQGRRTAIQCRTRPNEQTGLAARSSRARPSGSRSRTATRRARCRTSPRSSSRGQCGGARRCR